MADDFDIYLTNRTYNPENRYWCDEFSIPALWRCSEALGISLTYGVSQTRTSGLTDAELRAATLRGFRLLKAGKEATTSALASFAATTTAGRGHRSKPRYGEILRLLNKTSDYQEHLEIMRDFMREYLVCRYPLDDDALVFGKPIGKRRIHSMVSAQRYLGMSQKLLKDTLVERGLGERDSDGRFLLVTLLTVEIVEDLLAEKLRYVGNEEAFALLGVSHEMFKELHKSGILKPETNRIPYERRGFDIQFLKNMMETVFLGAEGFDEAPSGTIALANLSTIAECGLPDVLKLLIDGIVKAAGRLGEKLALNNLLVRIADLERIFPSEVCSGLTGTEACERLAIKSPTLRKLLDDGLLVSSKKTSATLKRNTFLITFETLARFEKCYFSLGMLRSSDPAYRNLRVIDMELLDLEPIFEEVGLSRIYRWCDLPADPIGVLKAVEPLRIADGVRWPSETKDS
ncbi:hypothetical protein [Sulfitobacter sp.]|uniref:hypothetical protein n=1 Tax=Sulfitobacter sp. TaxID=1903071 RepID=UPI003EF9FD64